MSNSRILGSAFWLDRRTKRYIAIHDHAIDAHNTPAQFRISRLATKSLNPIRDREKIIRMVCEQGFIRVRRYRGRIGWQFWGYPYEALDLLQSYFGRFEIGPAEVITFTDLAAPAKANTVEAQAMALADPAVYKLPALLAILDAWDNRDVKVGS